MRGFAVIIAGAVLLCSPGCQRHDEKKYFTGTVDYTYSYSSDSLNADSLSLLRPGKSRFSYDTTNYQSVFWGRDTMTYYYSGQRNRCISRTGSGNEFQCEDYGVVTDRVLSARLYDTDEKVLGYACRVLELQKGNSFVKYYVSREQKLSPSTYRDHRSFNWDVYGREADGGLILKLEHRFPHFTMHGIATKVQQISGDFSALDINEEDWEKYCRPQ